MKTNITLNEIAISLFYRFVRETNNALDGIILLSIVSNSKRENDKQITKLQQTQMSRKLHVSRLTIYKHFQSLKQREFIDTKVIFEKDENDQKETKTEIMILPKLKNIIVDEITKIMR